MGRMEGSGQQKRRGGSNYMGIWNPMLEQPFLRQSARVPFRLGFLCLCANKGLATAKTILGLTDQCVNRTYGGLKSSFRCANLAGRRTGFPVSKIRRLGYS